MKKLLIVCFLFIFSVTYCFALDNKQEKIVNILVQKIEEISKNKGNLMRKVFVKKLKSISKRKNISHTTQDIIQEVVGILNKNMKKIEKQEKEAEDKIKVERKKQEEKLQKKRDRQEQEKKKGEIKYGVNINFNEIKTYWLGKTNAVRKSEGLAPYIYSKKLEKTAQEWSNYQKSRGKWTHKRKPSDSFYDYSVINSWFKQRGVVCKNIHRVTHSENVGQRKFNCSDGECTDELKKGLDSTFNFYMSEKGTKNDAHYQSIIKKQFSMLGIGIATTKISENRYRYFLTVHYCTEIQ